MDILAVAGLTIAVAFLGPSASRTLLRRIYFDQLDQMKQLGLMPTPAAV